jgi:hypothetical protein
LLNKVQHLCPSPARGNSLDAFAPVFRVFALQHAERLHLVPVLIQPNALIPVNKVLIFTSDVGVLRLSPRQVE